MEKYRVLDTTSEDRRHVARKWVYGCQGPTPRTVQAPHFRGGPSHPPETGGPLSGSDLYRVSGRGPLCASRYRRGEGTQGHRHTDPQSPDSPRPSGAWRLRTVTFVPPVGWTTRTRDQRRTDGRHSLRWVTTHPGTTLVPVVREGCAT